MCRELEWGEKEANGGEGKSKMDLTVPIGNKNPRCAEYGKMAIKCNKKRGEEEINC